MYVGTDDHSVQSFNLLDGSMEAVLMRFQAPPTHITTSPDLLVAAARFVCIFEQMLHQRHHTTSHHSTVTSALYNTPHHTTTLQHTTTSQHTTTAHYHTTLPHHHITAHHHITPPHQTTIPQRLLHQDHFLLH